MQCKQRFVFIFYLCVCSRNERETLAFIGTVPHHMTHLIHTHYEWNVSLCNLKSTTLCTLHFPSWWNFKILISFHKFFSFGRFLNAFTYLCYELVYFLISFSIFNVQAHTPSSTSTSTITEKYHSLDLIYSIPFAKFHFGNSQTENMKQSKTKNIR